MIERQREPFLRHEQGSTYYLMTVALMLSAVIGTTVAGTTAANSLVKTKQVTFTETSVQSYTPASTPVSTDTSTHTSPGSSVTVTNANAGEIVPIGDFIVTVGAGDTLSSILREQLGSLRALHEIISYNNLQTPDDLTPGKKILIPVYLFAEVSAAGSASASNRAAITTTKTGAKTATKTDRAEVDYLTVDLSALASASNVEATGSNQSKDEEYMVVNLAALETAINPENTVKTTTQNTAQSTARATRSQDQYLVVVLTELAGVMDESVVTDQGSSQLSMAQGDLYNVVDLADVAVTPDRRIRVNRGDSLSSILRENLGSLRGLSEVARYNNLDTPDALTPGQIILIPGYM